MFEGPVTDNLDNGEVTDGTRVTAGQLALALTPYAQVADLAVNTAACGKNAAAIQSLAELASKLESSALAPAIAPLATAHHGRTGGCARKQHCSAAELADHGGPESNYSTTAAMNGLLGKADASALGGRVGHAAGGRHQDSKCPAGSRHRRLCRSAAC